MKFEENLKFEVREFEVASGEREARDPERFLSPSEGHRPSRNLKLPSANAERLDPERVLSLSEGHRPLRSWLAGHTLARDFIAPGMRKG